MNRIPGICRIVVAPLLLAGCVAGTSSQAPLKAAPVAGTVKEPLPISFATSCGIPAMRDAALRELNAARASGLACGRQKMGPAPPLAWNDALFSAAARHSRDMAQRNYFDHTAPEGTRVAHRASAEGYNWRAIAENIAGGDTDVEAVMAGWKASSAHCRAIMEPDYQDVALACVQRTGAKWGTYWTMVLGRKR